MIIIMIITLNNAMKVWCLDSVIFFILRGGIPRAIGYGGSPRHLTRQFLVCGLAVAGLGTLAQPSKGKA